MSGASRPGACRRVPVSACDGAGDGRIGEGCDHFPELPWEPVVKMRAGNSVEVLVRRYAGCLDNQEELVNRRIERALDEIARARSQLGRLSVTSLAIRSKRFR